MKRMTAVRTTVICFLTGFVVGMIGSSLVVYSFVQSKNVKLEERLSRVTVEKAVSELRVIGYLEEDRMRDYLARNDIREIDVSYIGTSFSSKSNSKEVGFEADYLIAGVERSVGGSIESALKRYSPIIDAEVITIYSEEGGGRVEVFIRGRAGSNARVP